MLIPDNTSLFAEISYHCREISIVKYDVICTRRFAIYNLLFRLSHSSLLLGLRYTARF